MKRIAVLFALFITIAAIANGQKSSPPAKPIASVEIDVSGRPLVKMSAADFAKYPRTEVKAKDHDGVESAFSGVELRLLLSAAGAKLGKDLKGPTIGQYLIIEAADGYRAVYSLTDLDPDFADKTVILADQKEGKPLEAKNGPWQVIATNEKKHARWVRQVTALRVRVAK